MATEYDTIIDAALGEITDRRLHEMAECDKGQVMTAHLKAAMADFAFVALRSGGYDLGKYDDTLRQIEDDLDNEAIHILALGVIAHWSNAKLFNANLYRNAMNTKDFQQFAPANLLGALDALNSRINRQYRQRVINWSYERAVDD
ncbi:MAG: hypothetical protein LBD92_07315 [Oscillospiraceae bacterium]|jgi:hypothetical protein|nr:hypothetical protein [Oscillospiraceae bacterium]